MTKKQTWKDSVVVITGAGSGIGRALALAVCQRGARTLLCDVNLKTAADAVLLCGSNASAHQLDVRDAEAVKTLIESTVAQYGKIDYLFNNAGIAIGGEAFEITNEAWTLILDINVKGVINGITAAYPIMVKQGFGHIINTASLAGLGPAPLLAPYAMTKHAVVGISTSLRLEAEKYGVNISVLCPAAIETPLLDSTMPSGLPTIWRPDFRRFLTALAGPPYPVNQLAEDAITAIEKNKGIIVIPARARMAWHIGRWMPKLVEVICRKALAVERADRR